MFIHPGLIHPGTITEGKRRKRRRQPERQAFLLIKTASALALEETLP